MVASKRFSASERAELRKSAVAVGDIYTQRIAVEDGAYFKGKVDIQREAAKSSPVANKPESHAEPKVVPAATPAVKAATSSSLAASASAPITK